MFFSCLFHSEKWCGSLEGSNASHCHFVSSCAYFGTKLNECSLKYPFAETLTKKWHLGHKNVTIGKFELCISLNYFRVSPASQLLKTCLGTLRNVCSSCFVKFGWQNPSISSPRSSKLLILDVNPNISHISVLRQFRDGMQLPNSEKCSQSEGFGSQAFKNSRNKRFGTADQPCELFGCSSERNLNIPICTFYAAKSQISLIFG